MIFVSDKAKMDSEYMSLMAELGVAEEGAGLTSGGGGGGDRPPPRSLNAGKYLLTTVLLVHPCLRFKLKTTDKYLPLREVDCHLNRYVCTMHKQIA